VGSKRGPRGRVGAPEHKDMKEATSRSNVAAPTGDRGGRLARRSRSREPGLGRVGPSGREATGWHHYDGAREIITERSWGTTADGNFEMRSGIGIERVMPQSREG
jgi:hypothetical protein